MNFAVNAALWAVGKALAPVTDGLLESWAASAGLGSNIDALRMELLYAQGMLDNAPHGNDIRSAALKELLHKLRDLAYGADDVLDELEYFRIKDALQGTYHAAERHDQGYVNMLALNARHTARSTVNRLKRTSWRSRDARCVSHGDQLDGGIQGCLSVFHSCGGAREIRSSPTSSTNRDVQEVDDDCTPKVTSRVRSAAHSTGKHFSCFSIPSTHDDDAHTTVQTPKIKFDRVAMSQKMSEIVDQLKPLCAKVSTILHLELLGSRHIPTQDIALNRTKSTPAILEPKLYGRDTIKNKIVDMITNGKYCVDDLTVLPILGPGGIGKTTLIQHIFQEVENLFQVSAWISVSLDFNANRLAHEIANKIPEVEGEDKRATDEDLIKQRLKSKRLLLVLDDMWTYHEDEWKKLLAPLKYNMRGKGNMVLVTTRIPEVASMVSTISSSIELERLGPDDIMSFFEACVFGDQKPWKNHPELYDIGKQIVKKLKGFPLAAKTVGRLLRRKLTLDHWNRVIESREWERQTGDNDIMPSLKLSYDYLSFHLQQCFSICALFPEDYEFGSKELVHLWIGLDILHSGDHNKRIEDVGLSYLDDLVSHGFFKLIKKEDGSYYVIHDLLHELAVKVSSYDCLSIHSSNVRSIKIPPSIRHLSIIVDNKDVKDAVTFKDYKIYLRALIKKLKVQSLHTLMLSGEHHGSFITTFSDLLEEARALRTIFLSGTSYSMDDMFFNFSKLLHLRYLRIKSMQNKNMTLPSALFRLYHLEVIDIENWGGSFCPTRDLSNLVKLRHFLVPKNHLELHSGILEVGNLKFLEELRSFEVGKEPKGFEVSQLGGLTELGGSLTICNLEKVKGKEEAKELKLIHKNHLQKLILEWHNKGTPEEENVLESLVPHQNLQYLCIKGHGGANCPSWLGENLSVMNLESLCLYDVSWKKLPPLGDMWFIDDLGEECQSNISRKKFQNLKRLELVNIPKLGKWVRNDNYHLFSLLEVVIIKDCPKLTEFPFSHPTCCPAKQEENMAWFPRLRELTIVKCPKLSSLPCVPWTHIPCSIHIAQAGTGSSFERLDYPKAHGSELSFIVEGKNCQDSKFWSRLCFCYLADLKRLEMIQCPHLPLIHLQKLRSLKTLYISRMSNILLPSEGEIRNTGCIVPVENIYIVECGVNGKELTHLLSQFPKLVDVDIVSCENITGLGVLEHETSAASSSANQTKNAHVEHQEKQTRGEEEEEELPAVGEEGLLLLPPQLQGLRIRYCQELRLLSNTNGGGMLRDLCSLRRLSIGNCPKFLPSFPPSAASCFPFPASLQDLVLDNVEGMETLAPLSNLISLTSLSLYSCGDLRGEGLFPLLSQGHLTQLFIHGNPKFFTGVDLSRSLVSHDEDRHSRPPKLRYLWTDDLEGVLNLHTCGLLASSLTRLVFYEAQEVERLNHEQEQALRLLTSLHELEFNSCNKLQHLPSVLSKLTNLKKLKICSCDAIRSLPQDGGFPSCLQQLDVRRHGNSEELNRLCRRLKGTIPVILN